MSSDGRLIVLDWENPDNLCENIFCFCNDCQNEANIAADIVFPGENKRCQIRHKSTGENLFLHVFHYFELTP